MASANQEKLVSADWVHLMPNGHELMGNRLMNALLSDNARYRREHARAGCEEEKTSTDARNEPAARAR